MAAERSISAPLLRAVPTSMKPLRMDVVLPAGIVPVFQSWLQKDTHPLHTLPIAFAHCISLHCPLHTLPNQGAKFRPPANLYDLWLKALVHLSRSIVEIALR